ncbi:extracellular solute-binding protein [Oceanicella actignis]|uniref:extracellular solute-binding protein n=1 Tax=Oceanicella actignis TaxID=1189325 RepID=UPI0011E89C10|nr:extracellular solute-binding protein [Oceanicella actignis]TYO91404.1 microcin C transport system substrate-binding protein [Oceanicella actignis]
MTGRFIRAIARAGLGALALAAAVAAPAAAQAPFVPAPQTDGLIHAHGISAFGDLKYPPDFAHFDYADPDAPKGGIWSGRGTGGSNTFDSLNPFILKGEPAQGVGLTLDSLLISSADEPDSAYGLVAREIVYPPDRSWVRFVLRPEARFADGSPLTAEDVAFSFEILRDKGSPSIRLRLRDVASVTVEAPDAVRYDFAPGALTRDLPALVGSLPIFSKAWWQGRDFAQSSLEPILGSGPYEVEEVKPGRSITYRRRDDYWARDLPAMRGAYNFDRIRFEYFKDYTAAFEAFKAGAFLFHEEFFSKIWATGYDFPAVEKGWVKREILPDRTPSGTQGFWFNLRRAKFQDPRVREAIALGFDFEWSNRTLFHGLYRRTDSFFENSPLEAEGPPSEAELALLRPLAAHLPPAALEGPPYSPPVSNGSGSDRRLLRRAMKLLDAAGWKVRDGLRRNAAGEVLSIEFLDDSPTFQRIIGPFIENLRKMGIDARLRIVDAAQYQARVKNFDFDIVPGRFVMSLTPGPELRNMFGSAGADQPGAPNLTGLANPAVDALIEKVVSARSREELTTAVHALDRALRSLHIWVPNWHKSGHTVAYWDVFGRPPVKPPFARGVIGLWWWDEEKAARLRAEGAL